MYRSTYNPDMEEFEASSTFGGRSLVYSATPVQKPGASSGSTSDREEEMAEYGRYRTAKASLSWKTVTKMITKGSPSSRATSACERAQVSGLVGGRYSMPRCQC